jgi:UDP-glucose 4-epimerase
VLAVGGAGYVGSHVVRRLVSGGHLVTVLDNLSTGHPEAVEVAGRAAGAGGGCAELVVGDVGDRERVRELLASREIDAVMHFAAASLVGESMNNPAKYWRNNVGCAVELLDAMVDSGVDKIVFSSSAAVYGEPTTPLISEDHAKAPTNTYGMTKLAIEHMLCGYDQAYGIRSISLRYFNAAGAHGSGEMGEAHDPETHLIPIVLRTALGLREKMSIFGTDYPTEDGTCIRDYIHVDDLADAHILAMDALSSGAATTAYNLGNGEGFSVLEVLRESEQAVGRPIPAVRKGRRAGDPAVLVASAERASRELGWSPHYTNLGDIIASAWKWHGSHPHGYS